MKLSLIAALAVLTACSSNPTTSPTCTTDSECGLDTVTVTDTLTITDTLRVPTTLLTFRGRVTPLPDARFCVYSAPIPADTTRRQWFCYVQVDTTVHFTR